MHKYRADLLLHGKQIRLTGNGAHTVQQAAFALPGQNCQLRFLIGVAHYGADHETVQLRLRQHLRAGGADGVLGCNYGKGCGHRRVTPSTVTVPSSITSNKADCVREEVRLISSPKNRLHITAPAWYTNLPVSFW